MVTPPSDLAFECRLDSQDEAAFASCSSPKTYSDLGDGQHTFDVRAVDETGNKDPTPSRYAWTVQ